MEGREDIFPSRDDATIKLINSINTTIKEGKSVLIPSQLIGTSQEILITLDKLMKEKKIEKCKIYIEKSIIEANSIHEVYTEFLNKEIQQSIVSSTYNPFRSRSLNAISILEDKKELEPGVIISHHIFAIINSSKLS